MNISKVNSFQPSFGTVDRNAAYHAIAAVRSNNNFDLESRVRELILLKDEIDAQQNNNSYHVRIHSPYVNGYTIVTEDGKLLKTYESIHEACAVANSLERCDRVNRAMRQNDLPDEKIEREILDMFA